MFWRRKTIEAKHLPNLHPELAASIRQAGQLRQDPLTGKWVIVAPGRAKRPDGAKKAEPPRQAAPKYLSNCPFCNLADFPQSPDIFRLPDSAARWQVHLFENKYPALLPRDSVKAWSEGMYQKVDAAGFHDLLATRWHNQEESKVPVKFLALELEALVLRYRQLMQQPIVNYIQIIRNHGESSGASVAHPHHQIFTTPILPNDVRDMLAGAEKYQAEHHREIFADIIDLEESSGARLVCANEDFLAFCPFAPQAAFEVWIVPRRASPYFSHVSPAERTGLAEIMRQVLARLDLVLGDPPFNYIIYSAPTGNAPYGGSLPSYNHFRWHIQVRPRIDRLGGFELATGLEIVSVAPEQAARQLRQAEPALTLSA